MFGVWADLITRMGTTESSEKAWERGNKVQEECLHLVFFLLDGVKFLGKLTGTEFNLESGSKVLKLLNTPSDSWRVCIESVLKHPSQTP